jgi:hypothetical protein
MKGTKSSPVASLFGPLQKKTFSSALKLFLEQQCPQMGGELTREVLVSNIQKLVDTFYPPHSHLRMGQVMWPAVDENETASYGKSMDNTRLKPVFLDLIAPQDIEALLQGQKRKSIRQRATVRLFNQTKDQGAVLSHVDAATMMRLSPPTIWRYVKEWEKQHQQIVPRRGTVHDMGPSMTHKRQICYKVIVEGKSVEQTARETRHSPEAITRYVKDYKRIHTCLHAGLSPSNTAFAVKVSEKLVYEYSNLLPHNSLDMQDEISIMEVCDDLPF